MDFDDDVLLVKVEMVWSLKVCYLISDFALGKDGIGIGFLAVAF